MKKYDFIWGFALILLIAIVVIPFTNKLFISFTTTMPYIAAFTKFFILATMGELLSIRLVTSDWEIPKSLLFKAIVWGIIGILIALMFNIFFYGVTNSIEKALLPGKGSKLALAFFTSSIMNLTFAPCMMAGHRILDTYIEKKYELRTPNFSIMNAIKMIDWEQFIKFIVGKTIIFFWIPAHTITFLLPAEYRILVAAFLGMVLGGILSFEKRKQNIIRSTLNDKGK